jgi:glycosyltransferase involved in cell wall biosynthesis
MNIAIDARWIFPHISGIGNYTRQLLAEYARMETPHRITAIFNDPELEARTRAETGMDRAAHMRSLLFPAGVFDLRSQLRLPRLLRQEHIRVFHSPNYMIPFRAFSRHADGAIRAVTTIHDLIPLRFPDHAPKSKKARVMPLFRALLREAARRSTCILTVSNTSRRDIIELLHAPPERVRSVYNGVADVFLQAGHENGCSESDGPRTLLYVGRADPYKNIATLLHALARLRRDEGMNVKLCIAGSPDPRYPEPAALADTLGIADAVEWTGYLTDDALVATYRRADLLVHPSRYEGFGLQILEAMACGTPVLSSNAGSLPEVVGNAGRMVSPDDTAAFVREIKSILTTSALAAQMREAGFAQAARFSWAETARQTLDACVAAGGEGEGHA